MTRSHSLSLRRHAVATLIIVLVLFGGVGYWASLASIHGAILASGRFVVESNIKQIRHVDGGYVQKILVEEGDVVEKGDVLVRFDDTIVRSDLTVITGQLNEAILTEARLLAQLLAETSFEVPRNDLVTDGHRDVERVVRAQQSLLQASRQSIEGQKNQLREQISQLREQIGGLAAQQSAKAEEITLIGEELGNIEELLGKGLISQQRVKALQRERARMIGEKGRLVADIAQLRLAVSEKELSIIQINDEERADVLRQLQECRLKKNQFSQQRIAYQERLQRLEVKAPQQGIVHELAILAVGGVIEPGEVIMTFVPKQDALIIEARIDPKDVDEIAAGQEASIRLPSLNQRVTPKLAGKLTSVSPDIAVDQKTQQPYYKVHFEVAEGQLAQISNITVVAGMPVEAYIMTRDRTVLAFLLQPLTDQLAKTFREE